MKNLKKLAVRNLLLNKKRATVTIIGIMLSTALICVVAGIVTSFQATFVENAIMDNGDYEAMKLSMWKTTEMLPILLELGI